jgi:glutathione S-transferase
MSEAPWELLYWTQVRDDGKNHMMGAGEFVRLMFELAGVKYLDQGMIDLQIVGDMVLRDANKDYPIFAAPIIRKGRFVLCQTTSILRYLGKRFGFYPTDPDDEAHADQVTESVLDFITQGRVVFHPKSFWDSYHNQVEEAKPYIAWFENVQLPDWLPYFDAVLAENKKMHATGFVVGDTVTYADIALFHVMMAAESQFPAAFAREVANLEHIRPFVEQIKAIPRIAAYLRSDRRGFFEGNSMM